MSKIDEDIKHLKEISAYELLNKAEKLHQQVIDLVLDSGLTPCIIIGILQHAIAEVIRITEIESLLASKKL